LANVFLTHGRVTRVDLRLQQSAFGKKQERNGLDSSPFFFGVFLGRSAFDFYMVLVLVHGFYL